MQILSSCNEFQEVRYVHFGILILKKYSVFPVDSDMSNFCTGGFCTPRPQLRQSEKSLIGNYQGYHMRKVVAST